MSSTIFTLLNLSNVTEKQIRKYAPAYPLHIIHCNIEERTRDYEIEQDIKNSCPNNGGLIIDFVVLPQSNWGAYWAAYVFTEVLSQHVVPLAVDVSDL